MMRALLAVAVAVAAACGPVEDRPPSAAASPFAVDVVSFTPGAGAGFGQDRMPDVVLGPPHGGATSSGSFDVVSLGVGGEIVVELGVDVVDGGGADLLVFENAFFVNGDPELGVFGEPGEVAVSADGVDFVAFPCVPADEPVLNGCAGFEPVLAGDDVDVGATDADAAGGDAFDLAALEGAPASIRFVRIRDMSTEGGPPSAGFDLDAVARAD